MTFDVKNIRYGKIYILVKFGLKENNIDFSNQFNVNVDIDIESDLH